MNNDQAAHAGKDAMNQFKPIITGLVLGVLASCTAAFWLGLGRTHDSTVRHAVVEPVPAPIANPIVQPVAELPLLGTPELPSNSAVIQASMRTAIPARLAAPAVPATDPPPIIEAIADEEGYQWIKRDWSEEPVTKLRSGVFTVHFSGVPPDWAPVLKYRDSDEEVPSEPQPSQDKMQARSPRDPLRAGEKYELVVSLVKDGQTSEPSRPFTVVTPSGRDPKVIAISNGKRVPFQETATEPVQVYDGYLRFKVTPAPENAELKLFVLADAGSQKLVRKVESASISREGDVWVVETTMPKNLKADVDQKLVARLDQGEKSNYAKPIVFRSNAVGVLPAPVISSVSRITDAGETQAVTRQTGVDGFPLNGTKFQAAGSMRPVQDAQVLLFREGLTQPIGWSDAASGPTASGWTARSSKGLEEGPNRITAALALGPRTGPKSEPVEVFVRTQGPRVIGVQPPNFGTAPGVHSLKIQFDRGNRLSRTQAEYKQNYALRASGGTGIFDRGTEPVIPEADFDVTGFDEDSNTVTLRFPKLAPDIYRLELRGTPSPSDANLGLRDVFGNFLEGTEGKRGTDFQVVLGKPAAEPEEDRLPSVSRGITGQTGPYVKFPEFTAPRKLPDGFNPSDHVETRVSRLYYFRDAHRVAQIVNREAKSFNRAAVDTRRRLADKTRDEANKLTDERRSQERKAVRTAQEARQAEHRLQQDQQALAQARRRATETSQSLVAVNQDVNRADQELMARQAEQSAAQSAVNSLNADLQRARTSSEPAQKIRELEDQLKAAQDHVRDAQSSVAEQTTRRDQLTASRNEVAKAAAAAEASLEAAEARVKLAQAEVQAKRDVEVAANEQSLQAQASEDRAREEQFRAEVAAAHEDPDTYAPGKPESEDPVEQVSVSVIGEGVIQLRGPIKGVNIIRKMIHEIDSPVGQVKVAVHTAQVNGEHGDRMEKVIDRMQKYIDHSRFLTVQSALALRKAVVKVASEKAEQAVPPGVFGGQDVRDRRYLDAFFGQDFIDELDSMDSEFLMTGNKLLSLHSMDSTSLASALFLLALAKNSTRQEILTEFDRILTEELPIAEQNYFTAGGGSDGCHKLKLLACNANFQSFRGFFDSQVWGDETMTPLQREFIRLGQIFKSQLITEMELKQRVTERALIEDRLGNYLKELQESREKEKRAQEALAKVQSSVNEQRAKISETFAIITGRIRQVRTDADQIRQSVSQAQDAQRKMHADFHRHNQRFMPQAQALGLSVRLQAHEFVGPSEEWWIKYSEERRRLRESVLEIQNQEPKQTKAAKQATLLMDALAGLPDFHVQIDGKTLTFTINPDGNGGRGTTYWPNPEHRELWNRRFREWSAAARQFSRYFEPFVFEPEEQAKLRDANRSLEKLASMTNVVAQQTELFAVFYTYEQLLTKLLETSGQIEALASDVTAELSQRKINLKAAHEKWLKLRQLVLESVTSDLKREAQELINRADEGFGGLFRLNFQLETAQEDLEQSRRPLDHKKLLDMLIDDIEDKYIELLEGTRAHTANVDDYIKRVATALEDDFNTQFYLPAFREVRKASRYWDVTLGKIETTSILANNRSFAKVEPQATMEFDLPKRDILIVEAMNGAKALIDDYGALMQDPTFLGLTKLRSGQPPSSPAQGSGGGSKVRNVLPGLPSQTDEKMLAQSAPGSREFGSALEALIPDPAIYKFETGTGFEIRPVIQPDGQSVVFHFKYMYTTDVREPVRADEKHLGRVKRHFIDTDVQIGNYELREVSRYQVALKAARTARGVPLLEDIPGLGILFRPLPSAESSLQQNIIMSHAVIYPTLFDLMGLRWAPAVADLDPLRMRNEEFIVRGRQRDLKNRVFDYSSSKVDEFMRIPPAERRPDLYRSQETIPFVHPNGYQGPGLNLRDSQLEEGYDPRRVYPESRPIPSESKEGVPLPHHQGRHVVPDAGRNQRAVEKDRSVRPASGTHSSSLDAGGTTQPAARNSAATADGEKKPAPKGGPSEKRTLMSILREAGN